MFQIITTYNINLLSVTCQLCLNESGENIKSYKYFITIEMKIWSEKNIPIDKGSPLGLELFRNTEIF